MICPGASDTEFASDPDLRKQMSAIAIAPGAVALGDRLAGGVNLGEIVIRSAARQSLVTRFSGSGKPSRPTAEGLVH
jgi:hypothetical protein